MPVGGCHADISRVGVDARLIRHMGVSQCVLHAALGVLHRRDLHPACGSATVCKAGHPAPCLNILRVS
jgi:hypothetical protein